MTPAPARADAPPFRTAVSNDGSRIAYERFGHGPAVILIGGALNDRHGRASGVALAEALAPRLTAIAYDRRDRGDSVASGPYRVVREVEDIAALIDAAGGSAALFGMSSGCALAIAAAASGLPVTRIVLYDPPFSVGAAAEARVRDYDADLNRLVAAGDTSGALARFLGMVGMPPPMIDGMRRGPAWPALAALAPTLVHDAAALDSAAGAPVPQARLRQITVPLLALAGGNSPPALRAAAECVTAATPNGTHHVLEGQTHDVTVAALAPALTGFLAD